MHYSQLPAVRLHWNRNQWQLFSSSLAVGSRIPAPILLLLQTSSCLLFQSSCSGSHRSTCQRLSCFKSAYLESNLSRRRWNNTNSDDNASQFEFFNSCQTAGGFPLITGSKMQQSSTISTNMLFAAIFVVVALPYLVAASNGRTMVWLCMEFCGENSTVVDHYLKDIERHKSLLTAVSFERYTLGPNATLVRSNVTDVRCLRIYFLRY